MDQLDSQCCEQRNNQHDRDVDALRIVCHRCESDHHLMLISSGANLVSLALRCIKFPLRILINALEMIF